ncbi:hypothetical protein T4E_6888 [Trichinella pseudospiralis]|uniref:PiggyBac transposable element-derived protein domain-containing protein n=1 Tax=Trichinella pseudospiralis TaxID=6337 RepID=A0A0V0YK42_TRIPS|nr:hypothetical protein T4E_6888 [Trichinella pseudospiralis]
MSVTTRRERPYKARAILARCMRISKIRVGGDNWHACLVISELAIQTQENRESCSVDCGSPFYDNDRCVGYRGTISTNFEETSVILIGDYTPYCSGDRHALSPQDAFSCIFSSDQIDVIIDPSAEEIALFLGLLLLAGVYRCKREATTELWSADRPELRILATMARNRFTKILHYIRFHDTLDGQLMSFCGRCPCRIDMKCKPGRCGVNMWMLCDVRIWCVNIYMRISDPVTELLSTIFVAISDSAMPFMSTTNTRLCQSCQQRILGYASHVDNEYSAMPFMSTTNTRLCTYVDNEYSARPIMAKLDTLPGAIRPRRKKSMLTSYVPKKGRAKLLSSQHYGYCVSGEETNFKPQMIFDYNNSKGAVDANSYVLHRTQFPVYHARKNHERKTLFIKELSLQMKRPEWVLGQQPIGPTSEEDIFKGRNDSNLPCPEASYRTCIQFICQMHTVKVETRFCIECPVTNEE